MSTNPNQPSQSGSKRSGKPSMCSSELNSRVEAVQIQLEEERKRRMDVERQIQEFVLQRGGPQAAAVAKILKEGDLASVASGSKSKSTNGSVRSSSHHHHHHSNHVEQPQDETGSNRGSVRSVASSLANNNSNNNKPGSSSSSSYGRQLILPPMNNNYNNSQSQKQQQVPQPPQRQTEESENFRNSKKRPVFLSEDEDIVVKCEREAAECDKLIRQLNHSHASVLSRKPQLPQAARGISKNNAQTGAAGCDYALARRSKATPAQLYMMNQWHQERMDKINNFTFGIAGGGAY
jgi:hypothetical protein